MDTEVTGNRPRKMISVSLIPLNVVSRLEGKCSGNGGSYPECHVAQYPLGMGKNKVCLFPTFLLYLGC
jgi:hypothetical protein